MGEGIIGGDMTALLYLMQAVGIVYVLFIPGLALSYVFFRRGGIDKIERIVLGFTLSIAILPLLLFYLNMIGVKVSFWSVTLIVFVLVLGSLCFALSRGNLKSGKKVDYERKINH